MKTIIVTSIISREYNEYGYECGWETTSHMCTVKNSEVDELLLHIDGEFQTAECRPATLKESLRYVLTRIRARFAPIDIVIALPALIVLAYVISR